MPSERHLIALFTVLQFAHMVDFVLMMPLGPAIMADRGLSTAAFATLVSSYTFASGATGLLAAFVLDRVARRSAMLVAVTGFLLGTVAMGLAPDFATMLAARVVAGGCGGLMSSLTMILITELVPYERRGAAMGIVMTSFSLASVLGIPLGVALASQGGWHLPFLALGGTTVGLLAWAALVLPPGRGHLDQPRHSTWSTLRQILGNPVHQRILVLVTLLHGSGFLVIPFISPYLVGNHGFSATNLATFYLIGGLATIVTAPLIGRLADRWGKHRLFLATGLLSLVPLLLLTHLPAWPLTWCFVATTLFMVFVSGRMVPMQALISGAIAPERRGPVLSFVAATQSAACGLGALIAGHLVERGDTGAIAGFDTAGWLAAGATVGCLILVGTIPTRTAT